MERCQLYVLRKVSTVEVSEEITVVLAPACIGASYDQAGNSL